MKHLLTACLIILLYACESPTELKPAYTIVSRYAFDGEHKGQLMEVDTLWSQEDSIVMDDDYSFHYVDDELVVITQEVSDTVFQFNPDLSHPNTAFIMDNELIIEMIDYVYYHRYTYDYRSIDDLKKTYVVERSLMSDDYQSTYGDSRLFAEMEEARQLKWVEEIKVY